MNTLDRLDLWEKRLWLSLVLFIPVSSTPLLPFGPGTLERPLAFAPALILLTLAAFRMVFLGQLPRIDYTGFAWLGIFTLYIVVCGLVQIANLPPEIFKGLTPLDSFARALTTWGVGVIFYIVARLHLRTRDDLRQTLRYLFIGMGISIAFAGIQVQ